MDFRHSRRRWQWIAAVLVVVAAACSGGPLPAAVEEETLYDPQAAVERATRLMPDLRAELVADASHLLPMEQPQAVDALILAFLGE